MPLDNDGVPFEHVSVTTLEATSEAIIQPLSRHPGFDRRLVYPMPHPYGAIGEARPTTNLPIYTGPRKGAPGKQLVARLSGKQPSQAIDHTEECWERRSLTQLEFQAMIDTMVRKSSRAVRASRLFPWKIVLQYVSITTMSLNTQK